MTRNCRLCQQGKHHSDKCKNNNNKDNNNKSNNSNSTPHNKGAKQKKN